MPLLDDCLVDGSLKVRTHPHLYEVGMMRGELTDIRAGFLCVFRAVPHIPDARSTARDEASAGREDTRSPETSRVLGIANLVDEVLVLPERSDRPHTVCQISRELLAG